MGANAVMEKLREMEVARQEMKRKAFLVELEGRGFNFTDKSHNEFGFNDETLNMVWEMWQAAQEQVLQAIYQEKVVCVIESTVQDQVEALAQTKAQAVPEGFVLVQKELTHEQAVRISDDENFFETYQTILTESDTSEDSAAILIQTAHKAMIEAQENE